MSNILKSTDISVRKKNKLYLIEFKNTDKKINKQLYDSIEINSKTIVKKKCSNKNICSIEFNADSVTTLENLISSKNFFEYKDLISLFLGIKKQLDFLKEVNLGVLFFTIDDILVIKNPDLQFLFLNNNNIFNSIDGNLLITKSFEKQNRDIFMSPELLIHNSIPFDISYKSCYFSISLLISYCIAGKKLDLLKPISWNIDDYIKILEPINNTKLFWALLRCQEFNPIDRFLLLI